MTTTSQPKISPPFSRRGFLKTASSAVAVASLASAYAPGVYAAGTDRFRVGLIGCGGRGKDALDNILHADPATELYAIADLFPEPIEETKALFNPAVPTDKKTTLWKSRYKVEDRAFVGFDAYKKVIDSDCNYIAITTPPAFRPQILEYAVAAGKHVFGEKPFGVDPAGVRRILKASEQAASKNLGILAGTQRRHHPGYIEVMKRIKDGAIGDITAMYGYWLNPGVRSVSRKEGWSDIEAQLRNWLYYTWLSGDHIIEQHVHQIDIAMWAFGGPPRLCFANAGRQARIDPIYGMVYDHFSVEYEFPNGVKYTTWCHQQDGTYTRMMENIIGTKGKANAASLIELFGQDKPLYQYRMPEDEDVETNEYVLEHRDFIKSIRDGKPLNEGKQCAESTLMGIMGRMAGYTGKLVKWDWVLKDSKEDLMPKELKLSDAPPAVVIPRPGETALV